MKTVWCIIEEITSDYNADSNLVAIFSTKEKATKWLTDRINHNWTEEEINNCTIIEVPIDND